MLGSIRRVFVSLLFFTAVLPSAYAQAPGTAPLRDIHADGMKTIAEAQVTALSELTPGSSVGKADLQSGADHLVQSGLFSKVNYNFQTHPDGVSLTFHVIEAPRIPVYFDNVPWFSDSELADAIRKKLPFFDGNLPDAGNVVDRAATAIDELIATHGLITKLEHQVTANPFGEGNVQLFRIDGASLKIAKIDFSDPTISSSRAIQQHLSEIIGKPYSRMTIDLFLSEHVRPVYQEHGYLQAKLGPPEVRLTGNPNQKLPEEIPVFVPVLQGPVYHWKGVDWTGNSLLSTITLTNELGLKTGDIADGMKIEAAWDHLREEYAHRGFVDAKIDPEPVYDDQAHTVSYKVKIEEGSQYKAGSLTITGLSVAGEKKLREIWPITTGEIFDKFKFEEILTKLQSHPTQVFKDMPIHYDTVGHWLQNDETKKTVDVLLDFK